MTRSDSSAAIAGAVCAGLLKEGHSIALVIPATLAVGILCGLTNGLVVTIGKITPFVATLGMMSIARGFTLIYTKGYPISGFSPTSASSVAAICLAVRSRSSSSWPWW